jgi:hypothetical protein
MKPHLTPDHIHGFVTRVDVKLTAVFAAARDKNQRVGLLPKNTYPRSSLGQAARFSE